MNSVRLFILCMVLLTSGCATNQPQRKPTAFETAAPRSILVVPVVNQSVDITASDYFLSTVTVPLAEKGYYVFPVHMVKRVLEDDGLADSNLVHNAPAERLGKLFGADAILYVTLEKWDAKYMVLSTSVTVQIKYLIKDGRTGQTLWGHRQRMVYVPERTNSGNLLVDVVVMAVKAAATKIAPNYIPLARQSNASSFAYPGPGLPPGPYGIEKKQ